MLGLLMVAANAVLTLLGADPLEIPPGFSGDQFDSAGGEPAPPPSPDPGTIGPGTAPGTTNGGD